MQEPREEQHLGELDRPLGPVDRRPRSSEAIPLPPTRVAVFRGPDPRACTEPSLVLSAMGIPCEVVRADGLALVTVAEDQAARARRELRSYVQENSARVEPEPFQELSNGLSMAVVWVLAMVAVRAADITALGGFDWRELGGMHAGALLGGEWWRAFTALFLHVDVVHLASNLLFGALFGAFLAQHVGGGLAALSLIVAGGLGNYFNALALEPSHRSIGASTAVFAAVGALVTAEFVRRQQTSSKEATRRWAPLVLGVLILGWYGAGDERTDVTAHIFGFVAGAAVALWTALAGRRWDLGDRRVQIAGWTLAAAIAVGAWARALA